jgi:hypothetical protein
MILPLEFSDLPSAIAEALVTCEVRVRSVAISLGPSPERGDLS